MKYLSAPVEVGIELTNKCNLMCSHCYSSSGPGPAKLASELRYEEIQKLIDDLAGMKVFRLSLVGGEPFIRPEAVDIVRYGKQKGMAVVCSTNGYFLDDAKLRQLKAYGIDNIQVSVDGGTFATHDKIRGRSGSFHIAVETARKAKSFDIPITIGTTLMTCNYTELPQIVELARDLNADCLHLMCIQPGGRGMKDFYQRSPPDAAWIDMARYLDEKRPEIENSVPIKMQGGRFAFINKGVMKLPEQGQKTNEFDALFANCDCSKTRCVVDSTGNLLACDMLRASDKNIRTTPFPEAWHTSEILNRMRDRDATTIDECIGCDYTSACMGGCAASAYNIFGTIYAADPRCKIADRIQDDEHEPTLQV